MAIPQRFWFQRPALAWLLIGLSVVPLLAPPIPPLTDLPGHIGRYRIELGLASSPYLHQWFAFKWALFGNIGADLLVVPLAKLFPLEFAVKLIVLAIPPLTVGGMLYTAREIHGHIPAPTFFALPLAYSYPFQFGFVNFTLSIALMFLSVGLWLQLGRMGRLRLRAILFAAISIVLFLAHCVGWAMFGVILSMLEIFRQREAGASWFNAVWKAGLTLLPLLTPLSLIINWWNYGPSGRISFMPWNIKLYQLLMVFRDRIEIVDVMSAVLLYSFIPFASRSIGFRFHKGLGAASAALFGAYLVTPAILKDAAFADLRMLPYALATVLLAMKETSATRWHSAIAWAGLAFFAMRMAVQTQTYRLIDRSYQQELAALDHVERGTRVFVMVRTFCYDRWNFTRKDHLGSLAIVRRDAYSNGMWPMPGGRLMTITYAAAAPFHYSPTQLMQPQRCRESDSFGLNQALAILPRQAFDYVWLIDFPPSLRPERTWLKPVWQGPTGVLYRIDNVPLTIDRQKLKNPPSRIEHAME